MRAKGMQSLAAIGVAAAMCGVAQAQVASIEAPRPYLASCSNFEQTANGTWAPNGPILVDGHIILGRGVRIGPKTELAGIQLGQWLEAHCHGSMQSYQGPFSGHCGGWLGRCELGHLASASIFRFSNCSAAEAPAGVNAGTALTGGGHDFGNGDGGGFGFDSGHSFGFGSGTTFGYGPGQSFGFSQGHAFGYVAGRSWATAPDVPSVMAWVSASATAPAIVSAIRRDTPSALTANSPAIEAGETVPSP